MTKLKQNINSKASSEQNNSIRVNSQNQVKHFLSTCNHAQLPGDLLLTVKQYKALQTINDMPSGGAGRGKVFQQVRSIIFPTSFRGTIRIELETIIKKLVKVKLLSYSQEGGKLILSITEAGINYLKIAKEPKGFIEDDYTNKNTSRTWSRKN